MKHPLFQQIKQVKTTSNKITLWSAHYLHESYSLILKYQWNYLYNFKVAYLPLLMLMTMYYKFIITLQSPDRSTLKVLKQGPQRRG